MKKFRTKVYISMLAILLAATAFFAIRGSSALVLADSGTDAVLAAYRIVEGRTFSVEFTHPVNKDPMRETYEIRRDGIYLIEARHYALGADVQTELKHDETLEYGDAGEVIIKNPGRHMTDLIYTVGTISDHMLIIGKEEISLEEVCGKDISVRFEFKP